MKKRARSLCLFLGITTCSFLAPPKAEAEGAAEEARARRIYAHLRIHDPVSAHQEAELALQEFPHAKILWEAKIKTLAKRGEEQLLWGAYKEYVSRFPEGAQKRELLEEMAWAVIEKGSQASIPLTRAMALLGAFFGEDIRGVTIIHRGLSDSNALIRALALELASPLRDGKLGEAVLALFREDNNWIVHIEAIKAVGKMQIEEAIPVLFSLLSNEGSRAEEKAAALASLVAMRDSVQREEIVKLAEANRAGLRLLACELVEHFHAETELDLLLPLLKDHHAEVRAAAVHAIGSLRLSYFEATPIVHFIRPLLQDTDPHVSLIAAWALTLYYPEEGQRAFVPWFAHEKQEIRLFAAAALAATGKKGIPLLEKAFLGKTDSTQNDPYVKMNLALGLVSQRKETEKACEALYQGLLKQKERWTWEEKYGFRILSPLRKKFEEEELSSPETINQLTRLELLNLLAILQYPHAQTAIKSFLQEKTWGISGTALALLLTEGDESALVLMEGLLQDSDPKVRIQAALIVASWGRGESVISQLEQAYPQADRELKEKILEGLGRVGAPTTLPFLVDKLQEPSQTLRIFAAAALLQCLNH